MATKTITTKVDDIDGTTADASFTFTWQGYKYHIDLSKAHAAEMKADFEKWVSAARRDRGNVRPARTGRAAKAAPTETVPVEPAPKPAAKRGPKAAAKPAEKPAGRRGRPAAKKSSGPSAADIRTWAAEKGITVASRGRLAPAIVQQYIAETAAA
ncbi:MAG: Lsr2 family protein [Propionibacteriaceae bacterium]|nr:Lsr2 family protein [Propionibacteriaceae bacterium]